MEKFDEGFLPNSGTPVFLQNSVTHSSDSLSPAISVVIPLYNAEKYISDCLESVLNQTFQNFEVIVVDDCSTDNSVEIVENYIPKFNGRLRLTKTEKNSGGGGEPRNIGLKLAGGEYIYFLDADDFILATAFDMLYNAATKYSAEVVYTGSYFKLRSPNNPYLQKDGEGKKFLREGLEDKPDLIVDAPNENLRRLLLEENEGNFRNTWTKFVKRKFLVENDIYFPQIPIAEDFIWVIKIYCHAKKFLRLPTPFYFYREYEPAFVTEEEKEPTKEVSYLISTFVDFVKTLRALENSNEILSENPDYCIAAFRSHFKWIVNRTSYVCKELSDQDVYETLYHEFAASSYDSAMPFFFYFIDGGRKIDESYLQTISNLEKEVAQLKNAPPFPAVSVIIPMYNAEKYIVECLESVLNQTFQNFEVVVVDDCSTDNSFEIVESYIPKFNGRLTLAKMNENTGHPGIPRNKGIMLSRGEYIQFLDADDMLTITALEELYTLAKDYEADVIFCDRYYRTDSDGLNMKVKSPSREDLAKVPTLESEDMFDRVEVILQRRVSPYSWDKFVRRKFILENEIFFPRTIRSEDAIWRHDLIFCAKKFLRVSNAICIHCLSNNSITRMEIPAPQTMNIWMNPILFGIKSLYERMNKHEFFKTNPDRCYAILKDFVDARFTDSLDIVKELTDYEIYSAIKEEYGDKLGEYDVLIPALCTALYEEKKAYADEKRSHDDDIKVLRNLSRYINARIDIKLIPEAEDGDFQILSMSDEKANVTNPDWFQKNGIGYIINSYAGKLEFVAKSTVDGQIQLSLKGNDVRDPDNKSKRLPYWIDFTKFAINEQAVFGTLTPAWHDKPYRHNMRVKADEEITVDVEWLPHRIDIDTDELEKMTTKTRDLERYNTAYAQIISKLANYINARIDIKLMAKGDFQIFAVSDEKTKVTKPKWFQKNGVGYVINSYVGKLEFVAKSSVDGQIQLSLKGNDVRDPKDNSKHLPYWIDFTKLTINEQKIFDTFTPVWHDEPYRHGIDAKANEEIFIEVEWLPHRSETKTSTENTATEEKLKAEVEKLTKKIAELESSNAAAEKKLKAETEKLKKKTTELESSNATAEKKLKYQVEKLTRKTAELKKYNNAYAQIISNLSNYINARIDLKLLSKTEDGDIQIFSVSDYKASITRPEWFQKNGVGYIINSYAGKLEFIAKSTVDGQIQLGLKGSLVRNPDDNSKRVPYWIDYTRLVINEQTIFDELTPAWHDKPYRHNMDVKAGEEIIIEVKWLPHRSDT